MTAKDVVFTFSNETWSDARLRGMMRPPERILTTLMNSDEVNKLLVANPVRWLPTAIGRTAVGLTRPFPSDERRRLYSPLRRSRSNTTDLASIEASFREYDAGLADAAAGFGMESPAVITTNPLVAGFSPLEWAGSVTYFGRDDWSSSPGRKSLWPAYQEAYRRIAESGMGVTAVSQQIIDRIDPTGPHAVVPNGVEPSEWLGAAREAPAWFRRLPAPRAVYVGTIDSRVDVEGLRALARARPELTIVLLGPVPVSELTRELHEEPNVVFHRSVGRRSVRGVLRAAELSLLAHRRTGLTEAMSPLKVYEYLAAGLPVLATDLPPVRGLGPRVLLADDVAGFASLVDDALALGRQSEADRIEFVTENSWTARHRALLDISLRPVDRS